MATSSITKNFVIEGEEQVNRFIEAYESSEKYNKEHPDDITVSARQLKGEELRKFLNEWERANV